MLPQTFCATHGCYYVHPQIQGVIQQSYVETQAVRPVVLLSVSNGTLSSRAIIDAVQDFQIKDDVFSKDFLGDSVVVQSDHQNQASSDSLQDLQTSIGSWAVEHVLTLESSRGAEPLPEGPYFLCGSNLHQAWKLYPDDLDCFATSIVQHDTKSQDSKFVPLTSLESEGIWKNVAVPSRLYASVSKDKPLAGKRISIKDNFRIKGVKSTLSSRPYTELYGPDSENADFVQKLMDLGAVLVGKTKMSAFLSSEEPTDQWIDFHAPFNPRGDGWQTPAGSTGGGAAALAGYHWLDYSIGTDTSGSVRYPAALCGLFALRYTSHTIPLKGVNAGCHALDALGLLGRNMQSVHEFSRLTVQKGSGDVEVFPKMILYPTDFLPYKDPQMSEILEEFVSVLEDYLGVKRTMISIADTWEKCKPSEANGKNIKDFLAKTGFYPFYYDGYHEWDQFRADYKKKFDKDVYVGPYMQWKWDTGSKVTEREKEQSLQEIEIYRKWFDENVLRQDENTASSAVMLMPLDTPAPDYRDMPHGKPGALSSFSEAYTASILGLPQLVLPIGQMTYDSRVSGRTEYHPITASLVGARGSDLMLINLAREALAKAGWPETVLTGSQTFEVGQNARNVATNSGKTTKL